MEIKNRIKRWSKLRFAIIYPMGVYLVFCASPDDASIRFGIWFIVSGLFLRLWANGYAVKLEKLTTCGPYAFIRHPLYLGTMLLAVGFVSMLRIYYVGTVFIVLMAIIYYRTLVAEERQLEKKFKDTYIHYKKKGPALFLTVVPYKEGEQWPFSFRRLIKSKEYKVFLWMFILVIAFHLKDEFMIEKEAVEFKYIGLIILAFILGIIDLVGEQVRMKKKRACSVK